MTTIIDLPAEIGTHVTIRGLDKAFNGAVLYRDFNLDIPKGKIVSILGLNGCRKSTLINMISGLMPTDSGEILFDGKTLDKTTIGYVFQNYRDALFPWMSAWDNIAYPLKRGGMSKEKVKARVDQLVTLFEIRFNLNLYPHELSVVRCKPFRS
jgi:NitT/TauT family transport system ATP-binding protein